MEKINFDEKEILEALERSGYLFESEISKLLIEQNYFVETNRVIKDSFTGKSREIDLVTELMPFNNPKARENKCFSRIKLVVEIKNTSAPLVLLTEFQNSEYAEDWNAVKEYLKTADEDFFSNIYWQRIALEEKYSIFTQYCSFQKKNRNDELMALHPDNIYTGLSKICQYCEEELISIIGRSADDYLRDYLFVPVLLISDDLYELKHSEKEKPSLTKSECSLLMYNYHFEDVPKTAYVFVVTKAGFQSLLDFLEGVKKEIVDSLIMQKNIKASHNSRLAQ